MGENTAIEWARHTFNPFYGCTKVSPACDHCYAEGWAKRSGLVEWGPHAARRRSSPSNWREPLKWDAAARAAGERHSVFGPSLGDPFDNQVDPAWRKDYFSLIRDTPNLIYMLLTKRPQNIIDMVYAAGGLPANVALGTTVEDQKRADMNVPALLRAKAALSPLFAFLSCEPLLGLVDLIKAHAVAPPDLPMLNSDTPLCVDPHCRRGGPHDPREFGCRWGNDPQGLPGVDGVIAGGESGQNARPMHPDWARSLRDQCAAAGVPFFFKQWGEWRPHQNDFPRDANKAGIIFPDGRFTLRGLGDASGMGGADMFRAGKGKAGALLDGVEHRALPQQLMG